MHNNRASALIVVFKCVVLLLSVGDLALGLKCGFHIAANQANDSNEPRAANPGELPFLVEIRISGRGSDKEKFRCNGAIISKSQILTSIKCAEGENLKNIDTRVFVGSEKHTSGLPLAIDLNKTSSLEVALYDPAQCGEPKGYYGLAILKTNSSIAYQMDHLNGHKINKLCIRYNETIAQNEGTMFNATGWLDDGSDTAKVMPVQSVACVGTPTSTHDTICTMDKLSRSKPLLEGTPLVRAEPYNRWMIYGIHTLEYEPWDGDCNSKDREAREKFVDVNSKIVQDWLKSKLIE